MQSIFVFTILPKILSRYTIRDMIACHKKIKWITPFFYIFIFSPALVWGKNIPVPFTPQAPEGKWVQPWLDACEETSVAMVQAYYQNKTFTVPTARNAILEVLSIKNKVYGASYDENASTITELINSYLPWEARIQKNPTLEQMKQQIDLGYPIIIPVDGKLLFNPHFKNGGPVYHMIVISGYDDEKQEFITQEPGTRFGNNYHYGYATLLTAIHDYVPGGQTKNGDKLAIFTSSQVSDSQNVDADLDGLVKMQEIQYGTSLLLSDTDRDGFTDMREINQGYSPTVNEPALLPQSLVKEKLSPEVFSIQNGIKYFISSESAFLRRGWKWNQIITVSKKFLDSLPQGESLN